MIQIKTQLHENLDQLLSMFLVRSDSDCDSTPQIEVMEASGIEMKIVSQEVESAISAICKGKLIKLYGKENMLQFPSQMLNYVLVTAREQPPPSTIGASMVYVMLRPDRNLCRSD